MRKLIITLLVAGLVPVAANAEAKKNTGGSLDKAMSSSAPSGDRDTGDGCGLGWQVTAKRTMLATTTRGTTNSFVPPTFGMTSGTIGCQQHSFAKNELPAATYAFNNHDMLTQEMAQGSGEFLSAFARTLGCSDAVHAEFGSTMQSNYNTIVGDEKTSAVEMFHNVKSQIRSNPVLANGCNA